MNAVFTIVAKNYLSLAMTLGDSIAKFDPNIAYHIIVADAYSEASELKNIEIKYDLIQASDLLIESNVLLDMAFKYDVTEFCTSIKPFCFEYLIEKYNYGKIIFFDPDVYLFNSIESIVLALNDKLCVVTPHYFTIEKEYSGIVPEELILFVGIFNLGFFGFNCKHSQSQILLNWWKNRLTNQCYADKSDALHTDQKWMDYISSYFNDIGILRCLGYNLAIWNLHERLIKYNNNEYTVYNRITKDDLSEPLVFVHFAGFDMNDNNVIHKHFPYIKLENFSELKSLYDQYRSHLIKNNFSKFINIDYKYGIFDNNEKISKFQRRLYRSITTQGKHFNNPFKTDLGSFYSYLKKNKLISKSNIDNLNERNFKDIDKKIKFLNRIMIYLKMVLGFDRYALLLKFSLRYFRPENQIFLIEEIKDYQFQNENHNQKSPYFVNQKKA